MQGQLPVIHQNAIPRLHMLCQMGIGDGHRGGVFFPRRGGKTDHVPRADLPLGHAGLGTDLRPAGVQEEGGGHANAFPRRAKGRQILFMHGMVPVRKVHPRHIHPRA